MKKQLVAIAALGLLAAPILGSLNAAVLPDQYETGEGFWAYQKLMPTSYSASGHSSNNEISVRKIDAENGIFIKEAFKVSSPSEAYIASSSYNSQYSAISTTGSLTLYSKTNQQIDIPDKYENVQCIAVGIKTAVNGKETTKYVGCAQTPTGTELMVGKINNGQVKIQKTINLKTNAQVSFKNSGFEGATLENGKHIFYSTWDNVAGDSYILDIEDNSRVNLSNKTEKAIGSFYYISEIGWKNGKFYYNAIMNKYAQNNIPTEVMEYNPVTKSVRTVGKYKLPTTSCKYFSLNDSILNDFKPDDNFIYFSGECMKDSGSMSILGKMNIKNGKITELMNEASLTGFSDVRFSNLSFSSKGNFLGISAGVVQQGVTNYQAIYSFELKTNKASLIKVAGDTLI